MNLQTTLYSRLVEPYVNNEASEYLCNHRSELLREIEIKYQMPRAQADDLLQDLAISFIKKERDGEGFNSQYGIINGVGKESLMKVEQYVRGVIRQWAKNVRYDHNKSEVRSITSRDRRGIEKETVLAYTVASSFDESRDADNMDEFTRAYKMAAVADTVCDIDDRQSVREQIDYCIHVYSGAMRIFKSLSELSALVSSSRRKENPVFDSIRKVANENSQFKEAFTAVLMFASKDKDYFDALISTYN